MVSNRKRGGAASVLDEVLVAIPPETPPVPGARFSTDRQQVTFAVASPNATRVEVWIYPTPMDAPPILHQPMTQQSDGTFLLTVTVAALRAAAQAVGPIDSIFYGYRSWGPNWPFDLTWQPGTATGFLFDCDQQGNRFNPNKLLLDPYALEVSNDPLTPAHPQPSCYRSGPWCRNTDTGPFAPKGIVIDLRQPAFGVKPTHPFKDDIIYEVHLRGLTKNDPDVPPEMQGTYAGASLRAGYLRDLGITAVEFLPIHETQNSLNDEPALEGLQNYWGYDSFSYFAPDRRYAQDQTPGGPTREWIAMVKAFHDVGLKVFVDVVYNHFDESDVDVATGQIGDIVSLRGLDNTGYYEIASPADALHYQNNNGVGPNLNAAATLTRNLVIDSLTYWTNSMGVDGFRFDLAAVLGNSSSNGGFTFDASDPANILNRAVNELPARAAAGGVGVDLIAEPYTASGSNGQQQGQFPAGWSEWNDRFRDAFRTSQNKLGVVPITPGALATRFAGSDDLFRARGRKPWNSVNYITSHDGFPLRDLYSYLQPNNTQPFPFGSSPGGRSASDEICWDHGGDPVQQLQAVRTGLAILALSAGVPMFSGGAEINRTQFANNNPFNLDTVANWLDWSTAPNFQTLTEFTQRLLAFRQTHPCLRPSDFFTGTDHNGNGVKDITWLTDSGVEVDSNYFFNPDNHFLAYRLDGTEVRDPAVSIYVAYNAFSSPIDVTFPDPLPRCNWFLVGDTSSNAQPPSNIFPAGQETPLQSSQYVVQARSVLLLLER